MKIGDVHVRPPHLSARAARWRRSRIERTFQPAPARRGPLDVVAVAAWLGVALVAAGWVTVLVHLGRLAYRAVTSP